MSIDTGRERIDGGKRRRTMVRLTPAAEPGQDGEQLAPSPAPESADQGKSRERNESGGPKENAKEGAQGMSPLPAWLGRLGYYALALLFVGGAVLLYRALWDVLSPTPFLVFYLAWVGAAAFGGLGPGLLATLASWLCVDLFFDPTPWHVGFHDPGSVGRLMVLLAGGLAVSVVGETVRRSRIHERRQGRELAAANAALRASEAGLAKAEAIARLGNWEVDARTKKVRGSHEFYRLFNLEPDATLDAYIEKFHPEDKQRVVESINAAIYDEKSYSLDYRVVPSPGVVRYVHAEGEVTCDSDGLPITFFGTVQDITAWKQAEEALRESEEKYRLLVENSKDITWTVDLQGQWTFISGNMEKVTGYRADELIGKMLWDFLAPESRDLVKEKLRRRAGGEDVPPYEVLFVGKDGRHMPFEVLAASIIDEGGKVVGVQGVARNITERKRTEAALRESEQRYRGIVEDQTELICLFEGDATITFVNDAYCRYFGKKREDLVGHQFLPLIAEADRESVKAQIAALRPEDPIVTLEERVQRPDGSIAWQEWKNRAIFDGQGHLTGYQAVGRDITERKRAEEAVAESRKKFRGLVEKINDWVWEIDADGVYTYSSPRARELLGYAPEEIVGKTPFDFMPPAEAQRVWNTFQPIWLERKPLELLENTLVRKDGSLVTVETSGMPVFAEDGAFLGYTGIDRDVTARKWAEEQLRRSEQDLNRAQAVAQTGSWRLDVRRNELLWSQETYRMFGIPTGTPMTYETFLAAVHPADQEYVSRQWRAALRGEPYDIEHRILADGQLKWVRERAALEFDEEGTLLGGFGTVQDITECKQAEQDLRESRNKYQALIETTADFIWEMDASGKYTYCSPQMKGLWGYEPKDMIGKTPFDVMPPEDRKQAIGSFLSLAKSPKPFTGLEASSYDSQGRLIAVEISGVPFFDADGRLLGYRGISRDVTERKQAEAALRESQSMLQSVMGNVPQGIFWKDRHSAYLGCNNVFAEAVGLGSPGDIVGKTDYDLPWLPEQTASYREYDRRIMENDTPEYHIIERMREASGKVAWVETNKVPLHDAQGHVIGILGTYEDITERRRAEETLRESEEFNRRLIESSFDCIKTLDLEGHLLSMSTGGQHLLEIEDLCPLLNSWIDFWEEQDRPRVAAAVAAARAGGVGHFQAYCPTAAGKPKWWDVVITPIRDVRGQVERLLSISRDITETRQAEETLRESEEKFRLLAETSPAAILIYQDGKYVYVNPAAESLTGYRRDELLPQAPGDIVHPDYRRQVKQMVSRRAQGEGPPMHYELKILTKDGRERWMDQASVSILYGNRPAGLVVAFDITERKRAEEALRQEKAFTDKLLNAPRDTVFVFEPVTGRPVRWNKRFAEVSGYDDEEIAGMKAPDDFYDEHDLKKARECIDRIRADGQGVVALSLITKQGVHIPFEYVVTVVEGEDGKTLFLSIGRDVTERKRAEEALRESEEKYRFLVENSKDVTGTIDLRGKFTFVSANVEKMIGYRADEVIGKTVWDFLAPECHDLVREKLGRRRRDEDVPPYEVLVVGKDGRRTPFELHTAPIVDDRGNIVGVQGVLRDITERKKAEEALREWNATLESKVAQRTEELEQRARQLQKLTLELTDAEERERKRLAEILHDDLQQVLAAAKFQMGLLDGRVRNDAASQEIAALLKDLLTDAIAQSRSLSHELSAPTLSQSDLCETFEWLAEQMQKKHGFTVHLDICERIELASEPLRALLYKAAREALFNAVKHAGVREARLRLRQQRGRIRLSVSDKGRGFDPREPGHNLGFGLRSIRERVEYLGGRMKIRSAVGKGSIFIITVPDAEVSR